MFKTKKLSLFSIVLIVLSFGTSLYFFNISLGHDWDYFDSLALVKRSSLLNFGEFPLFDPFICGGQSILANPQSWLFSPFILLTFLFPPIFSNLISWIICAVIGFLGAKRFFGKFLKTDATIILCSFLFVNSSWIGLHLYAGHVPYRTFCFLPFLLSFILDRPSKKSYISIFALLSLFILDGGMYAFVFAFVWTMASFLFRQISFKEHMLFIKKNLLFIAAVMGSSVLIASAKLFPSILEHHAREPILDSIIIRLPDLLKSFFSPFQRTMDPILKHVVNFHEIGCYLGVIGFSFFLYGLFRAKIPSKKNMLWVGGLFLVIGTGIFKEGNPYSLLEFIPIVNNAHVQTRYLIIFYLYFLIFLGLGLEKFKWADNKKFLFILVLMFESFFVRIYTSYSTYKKRPLENPYSVSITRTTYKEMAQKVKKPEIYFTDGINSLKCYEPAMREHKIYSSFDKEYYGVLENENLDINHFSFSEINIENKTKMKQSSRFNMGYSEHFISSGEGAISQNDNGEFIVEVAPSTTLSVKYRPGFFNLLIFCYILGILGLSILYFKFRNTENE
ncbi:MAG: hypothetical protein ACPGJV_02975 [Bacteriovoracaceae bacterium]